MRILYCINLKECKYVSETEEIWIYSEDIKFRYAKLCFIDSCGTTYTSEKIDYNAAISYLYEILKSGYISLDYTIFEAEEDE